MNIRDYLHLYIGQEIQFTSTLTGKKHNRVLLLSSLMWAYSEAESLKLILRPLGDMTDQENEQDSNIPDDIYRGERLVFFEHQANRTIWLLSKGFDLFGLIEAGLAIDKTTLNA